jgi:hypothetical protein
MWMRAPSEATAVARLGDPVAAPATPVSASAPMLNDAGQLLFRGDGGLLLTSPDGLIVVAARVTYRLVDA